MNNYFVFRTVKIRSFVCTLLFVSFLLTGCSYMKAGPAADSGFLRSPELMKKDDRIPFHAVWEKAHIDGDYYDSLFVAPVNTRYLSTISDWSHIQVLSRDEILEEANELASYFRQQLKDHLRNKKAVVVERPRAGTVTLEIAIVELVPTDVVRNATSKVVGIFVPGSGLVSTGAGGSIAIEGRYVDFETGEILARFKDREKAKIAPVDLAGLTAFRHARSSIDDWVEQTTEIILSPKGTAVSDSSPFTFSPW